ncbi:hypothetical protein N7474_001189 [Penicillium riverlandense]|uniref:uncharacterized protein n=1 Tax=Penicillium riverlandense TaxID=1903569 RepID=UPI002546A8EE|nr:uncharacterized protein N7474_001189 [Penicillium riverlandense]KAJ5832878.1 hypothetical protein N7474_001189 [Penicillium riverlandense]
MAAARGLEEDHGRREASIRSSTAFKYSTFGLAGAEQSQERVQTRYGNERVAKRSETLENKPPDWWFSAPEASPFKYGRSAIGDRIVPLFAVSGRDELKETRLLSVTR